MRCTSRALRTFDEQVYITHKVPAGNWCRHHCSPHCSPGRSPKRFQIQSWNIHTGMCVRRELFMYSATIQTFTCIFPAILCLPVCAIIHVCIRYKSPRIRTVLCVLKLPVRGRATTCEIWRGCPATTKETRGKKTVLKEDGTASCCRGNSSECAPYYALPGAPLC